MHDDHRPAGSPHRPHRPHAPADARTVASARPPQHAWQAMFPPIQPHASGRLEVGDGHAVHWEQAGHPLKPAALLLHGGPGAGCRADDRRWFDPQRWRIVLSDQRGAGRSTPSGSLHANTLDHLIADLEALRSHLGLERWLLFGGSWGATLAIAYAQRHPQRVSGLVLRGVFLGSTAEHRWLWGRDGAARHAPWAWRRLCAAAGVATDGIGLLDALAARLDGAIDDPRTTEAVEAWLGWEHALMHAESHGHDLDHGDHDLPDAHAHAHAHAAPPPAPLDPPRLAFARIGVHFARHGHFIGGARLLDRVTALHGLPAVIVQGGRDLVTPPATARALAAAWPSARLIEVADAGHASTHPAVAQALVDATDAFALQRG